MCRATCWWTVCAGAAIEGRDRCRDPCRRSGPRIDHHRRQSYERRASVDPHPLGSGVVQMGPARWVPICGGAAVVGSTSSRSRLRRRHGHHPLLHPPAERAGGSLQSSHGGPLLPGGPLRVSVASYPQSKTAHLLRPGRTALRFLDRLDPRLLYLDGHTPLPYGPCPARRTKPEIRYLLVTFFASTSK